MSALKGLYCFALLILAEKAQFGASESNVTDVSEAENQTQGCQLAPATKSLLCYYSGVEPLASVDPCLCTHLILEGPILAESGKLVINSDDLLSVKILRAKNPALSVIASVGSKTITKSNFTSLTTVPEVQKAFIDSVVDYVESDSINGIEISWDWPVEAGNGKKHREDLTRFTKELFAYFRENLILLREERSAEDTISANETTTEATTLVQTEEALNLTIFNTAAETSTVASPSSKEIETQGPLIILRLPVIPEVLVKGYDLKALTRSVDLFVVTTHNMTISNQAGTNETYHHSRLMGEGDIENADSVIDLLVSLGVPVEKIVPAVPTFGQYFRLKNSTENTPNAPAVSSPSSLTYRQICSILKNGEWTVEREEDLTGAYAFKEDQWVAFDDDITAKIKAKYFLLRGLPGAAVFYVDTDDMQATCGKTKYPVIRTLQETLNSLSRSRRKAVLESLEEDLVTSATDARPVYYNNVKLSEYRIVRIVDRSGYSNVHREAYHTTLTCSRQGYYRHPENCNYFYRCVKFNQFVDDFTVFEYQCPEGLVFDEKWEICTWPSQTAPCDGSSEIQPVPRSKFTCPGEGYFADPENCRWFFACKDYSGYGELTQYEFRCPFGLVFDAPNLRCNWPWMVDGCGKGSYQPSYTASTYSTYKPAVPANYVPTPAPSIVYKPGSNIIRKEPGAPGYLLGKVISTSGDVAAEVKTCVDCKSGEITVGENGAVVSSSTSNQKASHEGSAPSGYVSTNYPSPPPNGGYSYTASAYPSTSSYSKLSAYPNASLSAGVSGKVYGETYPQKEVAYPIYPSPGEKYQPAPSYPSPSTVPAYPSSQPYSKAPAYPSYPAENHEGYKAPNYQSYSPSSGYPAYGSKDYSGPAYAHKDYPAPAYLHKDYPAVGYDGKDYPASSYASKDYSAPVYTAKEYPAPAYAVKDYPAPAYAANDYPAPAYTSKDYPAPGYPTTVYPATAYPAKDYPAPAYPAKDYPAPAYTAKDYPAPAYPAKDYPSPAYRAKEYPAPAYPVKEYPAAAYPAKDYPAPAYPAKDYPAAAYPAKDYPVPAYPAKDYPAPAYPAKEYPAPAYPAKNYPAPGYSGKDYPAPAYASKDYPAPAYGSKDYPAPAYAAKDYPATAYNPVPSYPTPNYHPSGTYNQSPAPQYGGYKADYVHSSYDKSGSYTPAVSYPEHKYPEVTPAKAQYYPEVPFRTSTYRPDSYSAGIPTYSTSYSTGYPKPTTYPVPQYTGSPAHDEKSSTGASPSVDNAHHGSGDKHSPTESSSHAYPDSAKGQVYEAKQESGYGQQYNPGQYSYPDRNVYPSGSQYPREPLVNQYTASAVNYPTQDGAQATSKKAGEEKIVYVKAPKPVKPAVLKKFSDRHPVDLPVGQNPAVPLVPVEPEFGSIQDIQASDAVTPSLETIVSTGNDEEPEFGADAKANVNIPDTTAKDKAKKEGSSKKQPSRDSSRPAGKKNSKPSVGGTDNFVKSKDSSSSAPSESDKSADKTTKSSVPYYDRHRGSSYRKPVVGGAFGFKPLNETLPVDFCSRPGLFRHPNDCRKFYECYYDRWINKYTLHVFSCPIKLVYDEEIYACNWPFQGPQCVPNQPLDEYTDNDPFVSVVSV